MGALELVDRLLELPVEHEPVGDHHDLVEHRPVVGGVQRREPVSEPGDRVRLARPGRVLHQVRLPGTERAGVGDERQHGAPLVVSRNERDPLARLVGGGEHESVQQVEPGVARPHLLPQVAGAVPVASGIAGPVAVAPVERQEPGAVARQAGGHEHLLGVDGEVHDRPAQQRIAWVAVATVLRLGVLGGLAGQVVLDLGGGDRDAVQEQPDVDGPGRRRVVRQLAGDRQPVRLVFGFEVGVEPGCRPEVGEADLGLLVAGVHDAVPQHVDRPPAVELLRKTHSERPLRLVGRRVRPAHLLPLLRLRRPDEREQLRRVERKVGREVIGPIGGVAHLDRRVATRRAERLADRRLECPLGRAGHVRSSGTAATVGWARARRRSVVSTMVSSDAASSR